MERNIYETTFRSSKIIHIGLVIGILLFAFIIFLLNDFQWPDGLVDDTFLVINTIFLFFIPMGFFIRKTLTDRIKPSDMPEKRMASIQGAYIISWVFAEGAAMFALVSLLLFYHYAFLVIAVLGISALIAFRPRKEMFR